ncbi:MAG: hypothetical protein IPM21_05285 [Acidobacteria bacterium]|nr:hypothetical protein [Acidobacteriota bacterium]
MAILLKERTHLLATTAVLAILFLAVVQIVRVNREEPPKPVVVQKTFTSGNFAGGEVQIAPGTAQEFPFELNRRTRLRGSFETPNEKLKVDLFVIKAEDRPKWEARAEFKAELAIRNLSTAETNLTLGPGDYILILDNRSGKEDVMATVNYSVD